MTYDQIINMTPSEFWKWFWEPFGVAQLVSIRDRLDDEMICKLVQNQEWMLLYTIQIHCDPK